MHLRAEHAVRDLPTLHTFIRSHPLGVLTTSLPSENFPTLQCSHIPWVLDGVNAGAGAGLDGTGTGDEGPSARNLPGLSDETNKQCTSKASSGRDLGTLRGHIARANPHTKALIEAVTEAGDAGDVTGPNSVVKQEEEGDRQGQSQSQGQGQGQGQVLPGEVLIVFTSPVDHYITPQFYAGSVGSGKVAPTWNYAAVQVYGRMVVYHSVKEEATGGLGDLARVGEVGIMGYGNASVGAGAGGDELGQGRSPWRIADAPVEYISMLKKGIVGMEVQITRVEGRFKGSQEKGVADREGVIGGLEGMGGSRAREMAGFVRDMSVSRG
ncbi:FMN-binding split barrel-like protein [Penicillium manginii]|uniref:FMN-binding split barrel-like protein n=1 Tax=Penicillium manginii TaxID=203109 RepID=UPI00254754EF|nr:FMN-binding split barrel-like protein [Penicillium manginii]KAJ5763421.1 FMN-binding split barrel-like protein [Penicillium manginii]